MEGDLGWCRGGSSNNWDLHAVVRFACSGSASQGAPSSPPSDGSFSWPSPQCPTDVPTIDDLYQALLAEPKPEAQQPSSPRNEPAPMTQQPTPADEAPAKPRPSSRGGGGPTRSKRKSKKSQVSKEVTRVPLGSPSTDLWAWRKYGQKPIKGSPYPRGYYRCSTDKACKARKQVERCRADPGTLVVTYTGEHSHPVPLHRNSLAGTTRSKPQQPSASEEPQQQQTQTPPASDSAGLSLSLADANKPPPQGSPSGLLPATPLRSPSVGVEYEDEEDDDTLAVRLLLVDTEMVATEDDALLFLQPDDPAPVVVPGLFPNKVEEPGLVGATNNGAGACVDAMLFPKNKPGEPGPGPVSSVGAEDVMLFSKPDEREPQQPTTTVSTNTTNGGAGTASVINFAEDRFSISGLSAWEAAAAAATGWGL